MHGDEIPLDEDILKELEKLPHEESGLGWSLSQCLPPEREETAESPDSLELEGTRLGSAGNGKQPILWRI